MPLQNRVTPFGDVVAVPQRGLFTGNRGIIHDPSTRTLLTRRWASKAWLICVCEYKNVRRQVMATRSWTELFFLDEATGLAAGHRPCFECRRTVANEFRAAWQVGNSMGWQKASQMDVVLHGERLDGRSKRVHRSDRPISSLPDGAMFTDGNDAYLSLGGRSLKWSAEGYSVAPRDFPIVNLLTPPSSLRALEAGYRPVLHPTANP